MITAMTSFTVLHYSNIAFADGAIRVRGLFYGIEPRLLASLDRELLTG